MKKYITLSRITKSIALSIITLLLSFSYVHADDTPRVLVNGSAEVKVIPDEVIINAGVETWNESLINAKEINDKTFKQVLSLHKKYEIPAHRFSTGHIDIQPDYRNDSQYKDRKIRGYMVRKTLSVILRETEDFEPLLTDMLVLGITHIHGVDWRTTELRKYRDKARSLAIKAAKEKAAALAGELDRTIGKPLSINETSSRWWYYGGSDWWGRNYSQAYQNTDQNVQSSQELSDDSATAPGSISVTSSVTVTFELK